MTMGLLQGESAVQAPLTIDGREWLMTCVSMGNPHAITYGSSDGQAVKVCNDALRSLQALRVSLAEGGCEV